MPPFNQSSFFENSDKPCLVVVTTRISGRFKNVDSVDYKVVDDTDSDYRREAIDNVFGDPLDDIFRDFVEGRSDTVEVDWIDGDYDHRMFYRIEVMERDKLLKQFQKEFVNKVSALGVNARVSFDLLGEDETRG